MAQLQTVTISGQGGGVNSFNRPDMIAADECTTSSRNIRSNAEYSQPRKGYTTFADTLTGSVKVGALGAYTRQVDTNDRLIVVQNNKIYKIEPATESTWTEITTSPLTSSADVSMCCYGDWLFIFNGVDSPVRVSNVTPNQDFTKPDAVSGTFNPLFAEVYGGVMFACGVTGFENYVFTSKFATPAAPSNIYNFAGGPTTYGDGNQISFPSRVTGIKKMGSALVVFTVDGPWFTQGSTTIQLTSTTSTTRFEFKPISGASGCVSHKACTVVEDDIFYLTPQKEVKSVKRALTGDFSAMSIPLSIKIQNFLTKEVDANITDTFMLYNDVLKEVYVSFRAKDGIFNSFMIVGDMNKLDQTGRPDWYIDDNKPFSCGYTYKGQTYFGSVTMGQVYLDADGYADDDDADIITVRYSKDFTANNPTTLKTFREFVWFGDETQVNIAGIDVYVDGVLAASTTLDANDLPSGTSTLEGGIGTQTIADQAIGTEEDTSTTPADLFEVVKRLTFRARGKKLSYAIRTSGTGNFYQGRHIQYSFIAVSPLINPIIEK